jgi:hypothetical protein
MTDLQINIALAKAMGWRQISRYKWNEYKATGYIITKNEVRCTYANRITVYPFDYRDPVIFVAICKHWKLKANFFYKSVCYDPPFNQPPMLISASGKTISIEHAAALVVIELEGVKP